MIPYKEFKKIVSIVSKYSSQLDGIRGGYRIRAHTNSLDISICLCVCGGGGGGFWVTPEIKDPSNTNLGVCGD